MDCNSCLSFQVSLRICTKSAFLPLYESPFKLFIPGAIVSAEVDSVVADSGVNVDSDSGVYVDEGSSQSPDPDPE